MGKGESPLHPNLWIIDKVKEDPKGELEFNNKDIEIWNEIVPNKDRGVVRTPLQTYKMESLATIVSGLMLLTIVAKLPTLDVCGGPGYASNRPYAWNSTENNIFANEKKRVQRKKINYICDEAVIHICSKSLKSAFLVNFWNIKKSYVWSCSNSNIILLLT